MGWTNCIILLLSGLVCESLQLPDFDVPMHGKVQSPEFPRPYASNLLKQWDLSVPEGYQIKLTFTHLDVEAHPGCNYDVVMVLSNQKLLGKFCGQQNSADGNHPGNQPIFSSGNKLTLIFQTDDTNSERHQHIGFSGHYQAIDIDECSQPDPSDGSGPLCSQICHNTLGSYLCSCHHGYELRPDQHTCVLSCVGGVFGEPEGHLSSPGYPEPSTRGVACQYIISVEPGFTVNLNFSNNFYIESVDTEQGSSCLYHWLQVTIPEKEPIKLCGDKSPGLIATDSNTVKLDYHTDAAGLSLGWSLDYSTQRVSCPFPGNVTNARITPVFPQYFYRDYIHTRCDQGYKLMMNGVEINSYFAGCQSNGQWHLPLPECQIIDCGKPEVLLNGGITFISGSDNLYRSVIQYHCDEPFYSLPGGVNVSFTCAADRKWRDNNDIHAIPPCIPVCGKIYGRLHRIQRIIGGNVAPVNTFPWQVLLNVNGGRGGGIIIADRWIMTAAHNLVEGDTTVRKDQVKVYAGDNDVHKLINAGSLSVLSLHVHHGYNNPNKENFDNDIALVKLQHAFTFNDSIVPICLPTWDVTYTTGELGLVSGFGFTKGVNEKLLIANKLRYFSPPIVDQEICKRSINGMKQIGMSVPSLTDNMVCAGLPEAGSDSCQGDSGSAMALNNRGRFWAGGIVSWGIDCGTPGRYGIYTRVANYLDWINKTMEDNRL